MIDTSGVPECTECGACCFSTLPEYVRVWGVDLDRMSERSQANTEFRGNRCFLRMDGGHCTALTITASPSDPSRARFACAMYPERPDACRSLERGSGACRADRHAKLERAEAAARRALGE